MYHSGSGGGSSGGGGGSSTPPNGRTFVGLTREDYSGGNVVTSGYFELVASTSDIINQILIFSGTDKTLVLAVGGIGSEVDKLYIPPGGQADAVDLAIPAGSRISVKAVDANPTTGALIITYLK